MLPESMEYFVKGGVAKNTAGFIMMGCFVGGFAGIQMISRFLHRFIPSHVVDCDHSHDEPQEADEDGDEHGHKHHRQSRSRRPTASRRQTRLSTSEHQHVPPMVETHTPVTEVSPLLPVVAGQNGQAPRPGLLGRQPTSRSELVGPTDSVVPSPRANRSRATTRGRRPSILEVRKRVVSFVKDTKDNCDVYGPCYGYSDPCGQECFKHLSSRAAYGAHHRSNTLSSMRTNTISFPSHQIPDVPEDDDSITSPTYRSSRAQSRDAADSGPDDGSTYHTPNHNHTDEEACSQMSEEDLEAQHHHHVPTKPFLSIGLQTVIAIALHKFPEGFITYSTNHANPSLGFNVFMALFVHNIVEGFTMALPLFMALDSRWKAMAWTSALGGLSQPMGAGIAVLMFKITKKTNITINQTMYACLFAATAGIMTSVALQLFVESLSLNHNRNLSILCAFGGMMLLGFSNALVTD